MHDGDNGGNNCYDTLSLHTHTKCLSVDFYNSFRFGLQSDVLFGTIFSLFLLQILLSDYFIGNQVFFVFVFVFHTRARSKF